MAGVFQQLLDAITGTLTTRAPAATRVTGTIGALNAEVVLAVPQGANSVTFFSTGTWVGTLTAQFSFDGGVTYIAMNCIRGDATAISGTSSVGTVSLPFIASLLPGITHVRARCTSYTSGSIAATIAAGVGNVPPQVQQLTLAANGNAIGYVNVGATWYDDTTTPLAASATFTGTSRDSVIATSGTAATNAAARAKDVRCLAVSDVAGTLHLEVSHNNTTWRRIDSVATAAVGGTGAHVARIKYEPATRYYRFVFVNGGAAQGYFLQQTMALAA